MAHRTPTATPAYLRLAEGLRDAIRQGEYPVGGQLPTESKLASEFNLSRQTVRRAFLDLVNDGLVERIPGRGTFVASRKPRYLRPFGSVEDLMGLAGDTTMTLVRPLARGVAIAAAARLGLDDDVVHSLAYVRSHDGTPFAWTTVWLPPRIARLIADVEELTTPGDYALTVIGILDARLDSPVSEARQTITAVAADRGVAERLGCPVGSPVLRIDRLFLDTREVPVELSTGYFLPEQYTYRMSLQRSVR